MNNEIINGINNYIYIIKNTTIIDDSLEFLQGVKDKWIENENKYILDQPEYEVLNGGSDSPLPGGGGSIPDILGKDIVNHCNTQVELMKETTSTRELILNTLLLAFKKEWTTPKWNVHLVAFGSSMSTLGSATSDLDLCLVINEEKGDSKILKASSLPHAEILQRANDIVSAGIEGFKIKELVLGARVPILKLTHTTSNIDVDICIDNTLAVQNTSLLRTYADYPLVRPFLLAVKLW
eukprot:CAMPEP_0119054240 /NCGR_PEP_ID=MMETSP1177-20130426/74941_1 /TAXON_ID=2985 /ORGANISM="Ochromonas sp, Strain CCMP1899" /LENGTH=236 /DNA_ID=CAMNT_0007034419 /DNA_START=748 /DNA_END=1455 /DNA_ORIENTATION=-